MTLGAVVLYALSIGLGLLWWFIAWQKGALAEIPRLGLVMLLGLGIFQILGWAVVFLVLRRSLRRSRSLSGGVLLGISAGILIGNLVWWITPVLGAPLILLITVFGVAQLYSLRNSQLEQAR